MFANTVQPGLISLFSSTGSAPLQLFSQHVDPAPALRSDSLIHLLDDATSTPPPPAPGLLIIPPPLSLDTEDDAGEDGGEGAGRTLCQTVLHIQSPTIRTTFIRCPPAGTPGAAAELGLTLPWMHMQVRNLGREWVFEVGVADGAGTRGVIRCSTFQKEASVKMRRRDPPLLHIPLRFPPTSSRPLTSWATISLDLGGTMHQFRAVNAAARRDDGSGEEAGTHDDDDGDGEDGEGEDTSNKQWQSALHGTDDARLPSGAFAKVLYVKVYANCRLRRIWFSEGQRGVLPWEFGLYSSSLE
ncbi:hypothetical protein M0805_008720 [Coniferiporia weirii]|nr:hypothetical protein M0805_008720 [Coniferiporia weirii]